MIEDTLSQEERKEAVRLARLGKKIAFIQGTGSDDVRSAHTVQERYFRLGFLEVICETGKNYQGSARIIIKSRGREVLEVSWEGSNIPLKDAEITTYKPQPEWIELTNDWGKKTKSEGYIALMR